MIVCPNCNHQNPEGAVQCEACYTPLPAMTSCPNCGAKVQADASFCGQCGANLRVQTPAVQAPLPPTPTLAPDFGIPDLPPIEPLVPPDPLVSSSAFGNEPSGASPLPPDEAIPPSAAQHPLAPPVSPAGPSQPTASPSATQLQTQSARLLHVQTNTVVELPNHLSVIHVGKPNDRIPPDIDVSGFPNSEIVSRIHADIRVEGDAYYIEDVGSSNGTYINNLPLPMGNRHRLRPGDRIALGKGDRVTFLFQVS
ncbi:MAG TPA: FHA domain-containing protein [Synechococcales cyanobacterium M55_K2018_004]|nr:FHA domain-containing protein [Synechococcales cyanobacterium M55_K2018_004]